MKNRLTKRIVAAFALCTLLLQAFPISARAEGEALTGKNAFEITEMMGKGWNLGNTFDATGGTKNDIYSQETSWGNPKVTRELIDGVKAAGFDTIRIPVTWARFIEKDGNYTINPEFMARVKEVVTWAYEDGLFIIINVHHEGWVNRKDLDTAYPEIGDKLAGVWRQVSEEFADFDQHLIFEGMNEPRAVDTSYEWNGNQACYDAINVLNQIFVETVRNNGKGYNNERILMIPDYAASANPAAMRALTIPEINGAPAENIAVSLHCYNPYEFCLTDNKNTFDPSKSADTNDVTQFFKNINIMFKNKGIAAVVGECGCTNSGDNNEARKAWFSFFGNLAAENQVPAVVWDNGHGGTSGGECHKYFDRKTGAMYSPDLISAFLEGSYTKEPEELTDTFIDFEPVKDGAETILLTPDKVGFTYNKITNQMKVNHTESADLGFSMKVDKNLPDSSAMLDISKYAGVTVRISAWLSAKDTASATVGISGSENKDMASVELTPEWTQVIFDYTVPEGETCLFFKTSENLIYVDDISIVMNPTGDITATESNGDSNDAASSDTTVPGTDTSAPAEEVPASNSSVLPVIMIVTGIIALAAVVVIIVGGRKKK